MTLKVYNSLTRKKEEFVPIEPNYVGAYVCGPTVYGEPHVGHARSYVDFDVIFRFFEYIGYKVKYVQNITDVGHLVGDGDGGEDKILVQAKKEKVDPVALAYKYETLYFDCMDKLGVRRPTISARATGYIPEMIEFVQKIIDNGYAYVTDRGNVYFDVRKFTDYGKLSNRKLENNLSGERIAIADDKRNPEDFALWKSAEGGHIMKWNSPWGVGYPGWHLECSTISKKFLGETFDIHGGGIDNIFPHHESEIAQSEVANQKPFVHYFIHNNLVTVNGTKMGKSLGNFITLVELFKKFDPMLVRFFILQFHYRKPVDFSFDAISSLAPQFEKINDTLGKIKSLAKNFGKNIDVVTTETISDIGDAELLSVKENFENAMSDDFNTPLAIAEIIRFSRICQKISQDNADEKTVFDALKLVRMFEFVLGFDFKQKEEEPDTSSNNGGELLAIIEDVRTKLRAEKNYALSDYIRDELAKNGIVSKDKKL